MKNNYFLFLNFKTTNVPSIPSTKTKTPIKHFWRYILRNLKEQDLNKIISLVNHGKKKFK